MNVELIRKFKNKIKNNHVRWYLSSQIVWIGEEKEYDIEKYYNNSYGSFNWLHSGEDTILFNNENLEFKLGIMKVAEPIEVVSGNLNIINELEGNIKLTDSENCNCRLSGETIYYKDEDLLVSKKEQTLFKEGVISVRITKEFYFDVIDAELVGWKLKNASRYIVSDKKIFIKNNIQNIESDKVILIRYIELVNILDTDMNIFKEKQLKDEFKKLGKYVENHNSSVSEAIKESVLNILEYM